jgi:GxxExxY protein
MLANPDDINDLTHDIIGGAIYMHRKVGGPGLLESTYCVCFIAELKSRGHTVRRSVPVPIVYRGVTIEAAYRIDILVDDRVIVELKTVERIHPIHVAQLLTYLRLANRRVGLLINFNVPLLKDGIKRVINPRPPIDDWTDIALTP